jgi:UDP-N-acetylmuramyl pentapeptide phosphotransferase/UDP-N-acetylglucosamine-1-phosphate transferase
MGSPSLNIELQYFVAACIVIFFLGLKDDILVLSAAKKFIGQLIAAGIIIKFGGVQISNMHGFLGLGEISHFASIIFTLFTIIVIINSFNLIDGVDGLAGTLGLLTTFIFGVYFFYIGQLMYAVFAFSLAGSLIAFLIYNFSPAKIFMGDTGSLLIGLINSILVVRFINIAGHSTVLPLESAPAIGFSILFVPLFDTLRVFGLRILNRRSPFSPDRTHVHHFLLDLGFSHRSVTLICTAVNLLFIAIAFFFRHLGTTTVVGVILSIGIVLFISLYYSRTKIRAVTRPRRMQHMEENLMQPRKIFSLSPEVLEAE